MSTATATLASNSLLRAGCEATPLAPAGRSPAKKFRPRSVPPASATDATNASTSADDGEATAKGHQNSIPSNPATAAAAAPGSKGTSPKNREMFACDAAHNAETTTSSFPKPLGCIVVQRHRH